MNFLLNHNTNKNTILSPSHRTPITIIPRYDRRLPLKKNNLQTTLFHYIFVLYINSRKIFDNTSAFKTKTFIMKKITLLLAFFICLNISLNAQTYPKKENVITTLIIAKEEATPALSTITTLSALPRLSKPSTPMWLPCKNWTAP